MDYSFPVQKRALSAGELTDIGSTLVGTYTSKLNSVTGSDVIRQTSYMLVAASIGLGVYLTILRPNLAGQLAPKTKRLVRNYPGRIKGGKDAEKNNAADNDKDKMRRRDIYLRRIYDATEEFIVKLCTPEDCTLRATNPDRNNLLLECGMDQLAYLRLLWMCFSIFAVCGSFTLGILPIADWKAHNPGKTYKDVTLDNISFSHFTIAGIKGDTLYYHIGAGYTIMLTVFILMWWHSRELSAYRIKFFAHPGYLDMESDRYKRCVMIADIGTRHSAHTIKGHIDKMISGMDKLKGIYPKPVVEVYTPQDPENKSMRMDSHNELVGALQQVLNEHFAAGKGDGPDEEPLVTPPGIFACAKNEVPALPYFRQAMIDNWASYRIHDTPHPYAIIGFPAVAHASWFVKQNTSIVGRLDAANWEVDFAPTPSGIIWPNITMNARTRALRYLLGYGFLIVLIGIYTPPLAFIALLSNVAAVTKYFPDLQQLQKNQPQLFLAATTTLPPIMSATMFSILPKIIHWIAYQQGAKNTRSLQSRTIHWYLAFMVMAQLIVFPSLSTIFTLLTTNQAIGDEKFSKDGKGILKRTWLEIVFFLSQIPTTYQQQSNYWLNWLALRWCLAVVQLLGGPILAKHLFTRFYRHLTAREKGDFEIQDAEFAQHIPQGMFIVALGLLYAPIVPFITSFASIALFLLWSIHKVQAQLLYQTQSETGGRFWLPECDRILLFLLLSQGMLGLTCGLQAGSVKTGILMLPAPFFTVLYRFWLRARFNQTLHYMTSQWASIQTAMNTITEKDLDAAFEFAPKALRLSFDEERKDHPKFDMARGMLRRHGMLDVLIPTESFSSDVKDRFRKAMDKLPALMKKPGEAARKAVVAVKGGARRKPVKPTKAILKGAAQMREDAFLRSGKGSKAD